MTLRAFIIGLLGVIGLNLLTPYNDYVAGNTYLTGNHFPVGVFFVLLVLAVGVNVALKALRRAWALRQAELMLVFSMMLVSATVPASGLMRYWFPVVTSPPYLAERSDFYWEDDVIPRAPDGILLTKNLRSAAVRRFFEGTPRGEQVIVPWRVWGGVIATWGPFLVLYYLATFLLCGILRRQWADNERLLFPIARFPLELTEEAEGRRLLPGVFYRKAFLVGFFVTVAFGLMRLVPVLSKEEGWAIVVPVSEFMEGTSLQEMNIADGRVYPLVIGIAFLLASEVSLSLWLFYLLKCAEMQVIHWSGIPIRGGSWHFINWQQAGAFIAFAGCMVWATRRHLTLVVRRALGHAPRAADEDEPIPYAVGFWGLAVTLAALVAWYVHFGVGLLSAVALLGLIFTIVVVQARLVAQGGVILLGQSWTPPLLLHGITGGHAFGPAAAVVVQAQQAIITMDAREILSPHVMNALRIASVFERRRRLFLPAMMCALLVAMVAAGYSTLRWVYYSEGALNLANQHAIGWHSQYTYNTAHSMISDPSRSAQPHYVALALGGGVMVALQVMRGAFYWWPINPLGFLTSAGWAITPLWFSFFLGWLVKVLVLKFFAGDMLRKTRLFFVGVIAGETAVVSLSTLFSLLTDVRIGYVFLPS